MRIEADLGKRKDRHHEAARPSFDGVRDPRGVPVLHKALASK
jgi:hypothetical protein